jgi:hypothetical protein
LKNGFDLASLLDRTNTMFGPGLAFAAIQLRKYHILGLFLALALAFFLAAPDLRKSYVGAFLAGDCAAEPVPRECNPPGVGSAPSMPWPPAIK